MRVPSVGVIILYLYIYIVYLVQQIFLLWRPGQARRRGEEVQVYWQALLFIFREITRRVCEKNGRRSMASCRSCYSASEKDSIEKLWGRDGSSDPVSSAA